MDDDELQEAWIEYLTVYCPDMPITDEDVTFSDIAEEDMFDALMEFGDMYGWEECRRITVLIYGSDGT